MYGEEHLVKRVKVGVRSGSVEDWTGVRGLSRKVKKDNETDSLFI